MRVASLSASASSLALSRLARERDFLGLARSFIANFALLKGALGLHPVEDKLRHAFW